MKERLVIYIRDIADRGPEAVSSTLNLIGTLRHQLGFSEPDIEAVTVQLVCLRLGWDRSDEMAAALADDILRRDLSFSTFEYVQQIRQE